MNVSGKRGSNPRPKAWEAFTLPTELFPQFNMQFTIFDMRFYIIRPSLLSIAYFFIKLKQEDF